MNENVSAALFVLLLAALVLLVLASRIRSVRRAKAWGSHIQNRVDVIEQQLQLVREEVEHRDMVTNKRVSVLERLLAACEAPEPMETLMDEEED